MCVDLIIYENRMIASSSRVMAAREEAERRHALRMAGSITELMQSLSADDEMLAAKKRPLQ